VPVLETRPLWMELMLKRGRMMMIELAALRMMEWVPAQRCKGAAVPTAVACVGGADPRRGVVGWVLCEPTTAGAWGGERMVGHVHVRGVV